MNRAYILIETVVGRSREITTELQKCDWVQCAERVTGPYDIVAMAECHALADVEMLIRREIGPMDGVIRAVVCPITNGQATMPAIPVLVH
jgi:DNA-binding Lrp family transcriptional regulator